MSPRSIRVILVDDHALVRAGFRTMLERLDDIEVVGEASDGREALALAERERPDLVVMDLDMPELDGEAATRALIAREPNARVLVVSVHPEEERLLPVLEAGASGYLPKCAAPHELVDAIRTVAAGEIYVRPSVARLLAARQRPQGHSGAERRRRAFEALSDRERTVLVLTAEGYTGVEIGERLRISNKTVETYKNRIEEKLGVRHRTEYVRIALDLDLLHK